MTALEDIKERLKVEQESPGTYTRFDFIRDIQFLVGELDDIEAELRLTKGLINWQCGAEVDLNVA